MQSSSLLVLVSFLMLYVKRSVQKQTSSLYGTFGYTFGTFKNIPSVQLTPGCPEAAADVLLLFPGPSRYYDQFYHYGFSEYGAAERIIDLELDTVVFYHLLVCNGSTNCLSCHSKAIACYLLDENGYVVVDNRYPENSGRSFATLQSEVMNALVTEWEVYKKVVVRDYQDMCQPKRTEKSAGSASQPLMNLYAAAQGLLVLAKLLYGYVVLVLSLCRSVLTAEDYYIWESNGNDTTDQMPLPPPFPCETDKTLFTSTWNELKLSFQVNCSSNCTKHVEVYKVSLTNLILVALDGQRSCPCNENAFSAEAKQVIYTPEEECEVFSAFPYRRPPTDCFPYYAAEDASECGRPWVPYSDSNSGIGNLPLPSALVFFVSFTVMILT